MKHFLTILLLLISISINAQEITVKAFSEEINDLSARTSRRYDINDAACALIKVQYPKPGATFEGMVIGETEFRNGEYWVYVSKGAKRLNIHLPGIQTIKITFADFGINQVQSNTTYSLEFKFTNAERQGTTSVIMVRLMTGMTMSDYRITDESFKSKYKMGLTIGAEASYKLTKWLHPSVGIFYSQQGSKFHETISGGDYSYNSPADYLTIPIMANFNIGNSLALKTGIQPGFLLSASANGEDVREKMKGFQLQIPIGVSYEYHNFVFDVRYFFPLTNVANSDDISYKIKNHTFAATVAYNFNL